MHNCLSCPRHEVISDIDPYDWHSDHHLAIICKGTNNDTYDPDSDYQTEKNKFKAVAVAIEPFYLNQEAKIPEWCPDGHYKKPGDIPNTEESQK